LSDTPPEGKALSVAPAGTILCRADDVGEGEARGFLPAPGAARRVIVTRRYGRLLGWLDSCPHYSPGWQMSLRSDNYLNRAGTHLTCYSHGALFNIDTGLCVMGLPPGARLTPIPVTVNADGYVVLKSDLI
jgi:nitrite reductase/ring-hydroxylating ferredoxin subunit